MTIIKRNTVIILLVIVSSVSAQKYIQQYHKGIAMNNNAEYHDAERIFTEIIEQNQRDYNLFLKRGETYIGLKEYEKAIEDFETANRLRPDIADYKLARVYALQGNTERSVEYLEKHLNSRYKLPESSVRLDEAFKNIENTVQWINLWKNDWYSNKEKFIDEINYLNSNKKYFESLDELDKKIKESKKDHKLYALRAETYFSLNNPKAAVANYTKAIDLNKRQADYYIGRGKAYIEMEKNKDAVKDFETALKYDKDNLDLYLLKAEALNNNGKYQQAVDEIGIYLKLVPDDNEALILYADICFNGKQFSEAVNYYSKSICIDSSDASVYMKRGNSYFENKQYRKAYEDFSMSLDLDPANPFLYLQRGNARLRIGDYTGACADWERAEEKGLTEARKNISQFCK